MTVVAACAVLISSSDALAGGPSGKTSSRARVVLTNTEATAGIGIAAWVRPVGTPLPATLGAFRSKLIFLGPGETRRTSRLKNGNYQVSIVNAADTAGPDNTAITVANLPPILGMADFAINGNDRTANVSSAGVGFTN